MTTSLLPALQLRGVLAGHHVRRRPGPPVVVVGAGPVGMAVALGLAQRGISVTVLEAATQVSFGSRAICVSRHSMEVADRLGFGERLSDLAVAWVGGRSFYRDRVMRFQMPNEAHTVRAPMVNVSQSEFEQVMVDTVAAHPLVTLHWGARVTGVTQSADEAVLDVATTDGVRTLRAGWVVAADGGRSRVREALGCASRASATRAATSSPTSTGSPTSPPSGWCGSTRRATPARR